MAGAPPVGRRARTTRATPFNYVLTTLLFGAHSSSRILVPPLGRRARTTRTTPSKYVRRTLLFGAYSSSRLLVASGSPPAVSYGPLRSGTAQAPPIRLVCSALSQHVAQHISASCQYKPQDRPSNYPLFLRFGAEVYARHATDKHTGINPSKDHRQGLPLLREPIGLHTPLLSEPYRPSRDPLGLRAPCSKSSCRGSFLLILPGKEQAVLLEYLGFLVWRFFPVHALSYGFQYIRRFVMRVAQIAVLPFC